MNARFIPAALLGAAALVFGLTGCSDSDESSSDAADSADESTQVGETGGSDDATPGDALEDNGRPFGVDREGLATALEAGTSADRSEVDGSTIRLHFDEGSTEDTSAFTNCRVAGHTVSDDDDVVLVYPDGEVECDFDDL